MIHLPEHTKALVESTYSIKFNLRSTKQNYSRKKRNDLFFFCFENLRDELDSLIRCVLIYIFVVVVELTKHFTEQAN